MSAKIIIAETEKLRLPGELGSYLAYHQMELTKLNCTKDAEALNALLAQQDPEVHLVLIPSELRGRAEISGALASSPLANQCAWVEVGGDGVVGKGVLSSLSPQDLAIPPMIALICAAFDPTRATGVKSLLKPGSTVYTHSLTSPNSLGTSLDPCLQLGRDRLSTPKLMAFWSALNSLVAESLTMLPKECADGSRVEVQVGADDSNLCASVRFPFAYTDLKELRARLVFQANGGGPSPWLIAREAANFTELRAYAENKTVELSFAVARTDFPQSAFRPVIVREIAQIPLEDPTLVASYKFLPFNALTRGKKGGKAGGFKKSFSEQVTETKVAAAAEKERLTIVEGAAPGPEGATLVKGGPAEKLDSTHVKGEARQAPELTIVKGSSQETLKKIELYESKIESLATTLAQREQLIAKLNKEIQEINDPLKRGVVGSVVDKQKEGLMQNVKRLEDQIKESEVREKELMSMVDKAIQQKDKLAKDLKAAELKLQQASSGNNSLVVKLEKQLEEANRRNSALSQKITELSSKKAS